VNVSPKLPAHDSRPMLQLYLKQATLRRQECSWGAERSAHASFSRKRMKEPVSARTLSASPVRPIASKNRRCRSAPPETCCSGMPQMTGSRPLECALSQLFRIDCLQSSTTRRGPDARSRHISLARCGALHVLAYNLTRVMNIMGVQPLLAVIRA
jgi:hypothetical protein